MYEDKEILEHHNIKLTETIEEIQIENEKIVKETKRRIRPRFCKQLRKQ